MTFCNIAIATFMLHKPEIRSPPHAFYRKKVFFVVVLFRLLNLSLLFAVFRIHSLLSMYWSHDNCMIQPSIKWLYVFREEIKKRNPTFQFNMHIVFCWSRLKFTIKCYANIWQTKELLLLPNRELYQTYLNPNE